MRPWLGSVGLIGLLIAMTPLAQLGLSGATDAEGTLFVYNGNAALNEGYVNFGAVTRLDLVQDVVLPADLSAHKCVVLPINQALFSAAQKVILSDYVNGGGKLFAIADHDGFAGSHATFNDLAATLGSGLSITGGAIDGGFHTSNNINANPLTQDVGAIRYASTPAIAAVGAGVVDVQTEGGTDMVGHEAIGAGLFVLSGDSNIFSDNSELGYPNFDNGLLVQNYCNPAVPTKLEAEPIVARVDANPKVTLLTFQATLTLAAGGAPVVGAPVTFSGSTMVPNLSPIGFSCTATTDANGLATCTASVLAEAVALKEAQYRATFPGAGALRKSTDLGPILSVLGNDVLPTP